jgi:hypothetical protein
MSAFIIDAAIDAALAYIADNSTKLDVLSTISTPVFANIATDSLATTTLTAGAGNGDYTIADGDTDGRKLTVAQQADITITASGTAKHVVLHNGSDTIYYATTTTDQALTAGGGNTVTVPSFSHTIRDAT